jgi:chromosome segregation ATPase
MDGVSDDSAALEARVRQLEAANEELRAVNLRLARGRLGSSEAAAASVQARMEALRETVAERERRIEKLTAIAAHNDSLYQMQVAWNDAARYRTADRAVELLGRFAVLRALVRAGRWLDSHVGK